MTEMNVIDKLKTLRRHIKDKNVNSHSIGIFKEGLVVYLYKETNVILPKTWEGLDVKYTIIGDVNPANE